VKMCASVGLKLMLVSSKYMFRIITSSNGRYILFCAKKNTELVKCPAEDDQ